MIVEIEISDANREEAQKINTLAGIVLPQNKTGLRATEIGFLGELIVGNYLDSLPHLNQLGNTVYHYDIIYKGFKIEVKSMNRFVKPLPNTDCCLTTYFSQNCDIYVFVGILNDKRKAWIKGWIDRKGFESKAKFIKAGTVRERDGFIYKWDNWIIQVKDLFPIETLKTIQSKNLNLF